MTQLQPPPIALLDPYEGEEVLPLYTTEVAVSGGETRHARASGRARSADGALDLDLRLPRELGGPGGATNPEQLFAAGYAACFHGALSLVAAKSRTAIPDAKVTARVTFGRDPADGLYLLTADLEVALPGVDPANAETLLREAERICPYAKMARQGIAGTVRLST